MINAPGGSTPGALHFFGFCPSVRLGFLEPHCCWSLPMAVAAPMIGHPLDVRHHAVAEIGLVRHGNAIGDNEIAPWRYAWPASRPSLADRCYSDVRPCLPILRWRSLRLEASRCRRQDRGQDGY